STSKRILADEGIEPTSNGCFASKQVHGTLYGSILQIVEAFGVLRPRPDDTDESWDCSRRPKLRVVSCIPLGELGRTRREASSPGPSGAWRSCSSRSEACESR